MLKNAWYRGPLHSTTIYATLIPARLPLPPGPRSRQGRVRLSDTPPVPPFFSVFRIHNSHGCVFFVGLLRENISLLARTFLSRISTPSWVSTLLSHGAALMERRHMVREGGECPFRAYLTGTSPPSSLSWLDPLPSPPAYARKLCFRS